MSRVLMLFLLITIVTGCMSDDVEEDDNEDLIEDGRYCAQINYYNPSTQTSGGYQLFVEVEGNLLVKIYWPNGGWLDDSHFDPSEIIDPKKIKSPCICFLDFLLMYHCLARKEFLPFRCATLIGTFDAATIHSGSIMVL
jgi:hypothetical protein